MTKKQLRIRYKERRSTISQDTLSEWSLAIANRLLDLPIWHYSFYHLFLSIPGKREVDTQDILHILQGKDKNIVLSKSNFTDGGLTNYLLTDSTVIKQNAWGIPEPETGIEIPPSQIDVVFLPLLAFDRKGNRVGYGKGFYDRFLLECTTNPVKVGLSFFEPEQQEIPADPGDVPMDFCVTPDRIYDFK